MDSLMKSKGRRPRTGAIYTCPQCGKEFYVQPSTVGKRVCCSIACKNLYQQRQAESPCQTCGSVFTKAQSYCARFCSRKCYLKSRVPDKGCRVCGKQLPKAAMTYCSQECNLKGRRAGKEIPCEVCSEMMYVTEKSTKRFCSYKCSNEAKKGPKSDGPGSKLLRSDGYIAVYYPAHHDSNRSRYILEHRLVAEQKYGRRILKTEHVHHIDGNKLNNHPDNLEVISPSAHSVITSKQGVAKRKNQKAELEEYRKRFGPLE